MSQTAARRHRLAVARTFPQARCPHCDSSFARIDFPIQHLERCERLAAERAAAVQHPEPVSEPSLWRRLLGALGIEQRGAAE